MKHILTLSILFFLFSCSTTNTVSISEAGDKSPRQVNSREVTTHVIKQKLPIAIQQVNSNSIEQVLTDRISSKILKDDFSISTSQNSFFTMKISAKGEEKGKFGKYTRYDISADLALIRTTDGKVLAKEHFQETGKRTTGISKAQNNTATAISGPIGDWLAKESLKVKNGIHACALSIDLSDFNDSWFNKTDRSLKLSKSVSRFTSMAKSYDGIIDCRLISSKGDIYTFRIIYQEDNFPNGLSSRSIGQNDIEVDSEDPLAELTKIIFTSNQ
ncbi:hypothetical protein PQO03_01500 [Lentisphaera profundi]|uniref:Lipoprotein n=1 Tax=Lentisphaera profundi TaxID=1658616 RepID=A0ABY7VUS2_9BACT|nr:hypothetical protein [Lentisphaera profundi]WDE96642.1 hypothetical protein PQO03_01500 [Lentisphaera profundi]